MRKKTILTITVAIFCFSAAMAKLNLPDTVVVLQGGDTIEDAFIIEAIPFSDSGTTMGYTDDYDEACPYEGSTSPDVVYEFTPEEDVSIDLIMCRGSDYDTKLYVYQNSPDSLIACNDDSCPYYISALWDVGLTTGNDYYVVIDGYGGDAGNYTIDIAEVPPPEFLCPEETIFGQPAPSSTWTTAISDANSDGSLLVFDNFSCDRLISGVKFWGVDMRNPDDWYSCIQDLMTFEIKFYENDNGVPGNMVASSQSDIEPVPQGFFYCYMLLFEFQASLDPPIDLPEAWISIQSIGGSEDCLFNWFYGDGMDDLAYQQNADELIPLSFDMSLCLSGSQTEIEPGDPLPNTFESLDCFPNPFNSSTVIKYALPQGSKVTVAIYDILGRRVETLVEGEQQAGYHQVVWDAGGHSSGLYFYRIHAGEYVSTRKMVLLK